MSHGDARERLEGLIASSGDAVASLTPHAGLELILRFYGDDPTDESLYCVWTNVSRHGGEELGFEFRWCCSHSGDSQGAATSDFTLLFKIGPPAIAGDFHGMMAWCSGPEEIATFRSTIEACDAFEAWGHSPAAEVLLLWDDIRTSAHALFDCWGVRDPSRPVVSMTEEQWLRSDDVSLMLKWFRQKWSGEEADLDRILQRYCLACCRRIWRLLPQEASRAGVEVAERFVDGLATRAELGQAEWLAEGAAFKIDQALEPELIALWCNEVSRIPPDDLGAMIHSPRPEDDLSPHRLLKHAAYFADMAMCYPGIKPKESIERYRLFLPAPLLREVVGNPFRSKPDRPRE
ncbi:hypothetical protein EP7_005360 [Isosphaeraceae bacterium EP7]